MSLAVRIRFLVAGLSACATVASAQPKPAYPAPPVVAPPTVRPVPAPPAPPPPPRADDPSRRYPLVRVNAPAWPAPMPLRALPSSPDWVGEDAYPPEAYRREMEGQVVFETWIGTDGVPKACRILRPSPHVLLDDGTCDQAMRMRFEPPTNVAGERIEAVYRARLTWLMSDPTTFGPALLRADLDLSDGRANDCRLMRTGAVPREWMRFACITLVGERAHFLGEHLAAARRATILVEMQPDGAEPMTEAAGVGRLVARRRTSFQVDRGGEIDGCRTTIDEGFGPRLLEYSGECGLFLTQAWLERGPGENAPGSGAIEIRVFVED